MIIFMLGFFFFKHRVNGNNGNGFFTLQYKKTDSFTSIVMCKKAYCRKVYQTELCDVFFLLIDKIFEKHSRNIEITEMDYFCIY